VPLALICSNQPKRIIGACSRGAVYCRKKKEDDNRPRNIAEQSFDLLSDETASAFRKVDT